MKVPQERKFQGANVPWNESSTGAKVLYGPFAPGNESAEERKGLESIMLHVLHMSSDSFL